MTDMIKGFYVVLAEDVREDDFEMIESAVRMIKGVLSVERNPADADDWMNRAVVRNQLINQIYEVLK